MWTKGQRVLARRSDENHWYPGTIRHIDAGRHYVIFDDGEDGFVTDEQLLEVRLEVGDRVGGRMPAGRVYTPGRVTRTDGDKIYVTYDQGDQEWTTLGMIRLERARSKGTQTHEWMVGDRVLAEWSPDRFWYPATIQDIDGDRLHVYFDDGEDDWRPLGKVARLELAVGSRVFGRWQGGPYYYPGKITRIEGERIFIRYDDGDQEWTTLQLVRVRRSTGSLPWKVGQRVLAHWAPEPFFYPGVIREIKEEYLHVRYDDGDQAWVMPEQIRELAIEVGTRVFARWQEGPNYYPGEIEEQRGDRILVRYDNGREEWSRIALVRVLPGDLPSESTRDNER